MIDESLYNLFENYTQPNSPKPSFVVMGMASVRTIQHLLARIQGCHLVSTFTQAYINNNAT